MGIDIELLGQTDQETWNRLVERASYTNPFHRYQALDLLAEQTGSQLVPLVGYNGNEPIGVFPFFVTNRGRWGAVRSPPMVLRSFYLGPVLLDLDNMKRRKIERFQRAFIDGCLAWIDDHLEAVSVKIRVDPRFADVRPFNWAGFDATPSYTYVLDLTQDDESLLRQFSRDARSNIQNADNHTYSIEEGGRSGVQRVIEQVEARLDEQGESYRLAPSFVLALYDRLPEDSIRSYLCRADGEVATGMVVLESGDTMYRWQGGVVADVDLPATDLLDWHLVQEAKARDRTRYDLVGANLPQLCEYKAKFGPDVVAYYNLERKTPLLRLSARTRSVTSGLRNLAVGGWSWLLP